jgi:hypothetical protein
MDQLPTIFSKDDRVKWVSAMQGYTYVNQIYTEVYQFLRDNGHFRDALDAEDIESRGKDKLIQNVALAYLSGDDELDDNHGLLNWIISRWRVEELRDLIWFLWTLRKGQRDDSDAKVLSLWAVLDHRAKVSAETDRRILSRLCLLSVFVDELNEQTTRLITRGAPYVELDHNSYILIAELKRLVDGFPAQVADIFSAMLTKFAPTYQQEDVEYVLKKLYKSGGQVRQKANSIFERYLEYGVEFPARIRAELL